MIVEVNWARDEYLLADGTTITGRELHQMETRRIQQGNQFTATTEYTPKTKYEDELFAGFKQEVGQEIFDFLKSSDRYKRVRADFENVGPMGGKSVNISGWATDNDGNAVIPFMLNVYCDPVVYERMKSELLEAQEFAKSQEDIKKFLTDD